MSVDNKKIIVYDHEKDDFFSATNEPEHQPDRDQNLDSEYHKDEKPVRIINK